MTAKPPLDPVCLVHGLRASEHECLYCALCFRSLTPDVCYEEADGQKVDLCVPCGTAEAREMRGS